MKKILFAVLFFAPAFAFADVRINEIAWMGDLVSSDHEWIELYNDNDASQDLSGWKFFGIDSSDSTKEKFSFSLSGSISGKGYFLIESKRTLKDLSPYLASDIAPVTFSLVNTGEVLLLKNADGSKIDEVKPSLKTKWDKGNNTTKETMQWNGSQWIEATPTPRLKNKMVDTVVIPKIETEAKTDSSSVSNNSGTSAHESPLPLSDFSQKQELSVSAGRNRITAVGNSVVFETYAVDAKGGKAQNVSSLWSFGDGLQAGGSKVSHVYKYPGDYAVVLNVMSGENQAVSRAEVKVFSPEISFEMAEDGTIFLVNNSSYELNIGGWKITGTTGNFVIAPDTIIEAGKKIIFSKVITGIDFSLCQAVDLLSGDGMIVSSFAKVQKVIMPVATTLIEIPVVAEKKIEPVVSIAPVVSKLKTETAAAIISVPTLEKEKTMPAQKITLKKPDGFFTKIWKMFF
ncbi:MAG: lamin tail domain-containing protein [Candidatus Parcubacteria bacterium]|nr:lamin tail domain-containing protein [Candidatus Parcubacteria bacterium]